MASANVLSGNRFNWGDDVGDEEAALEQLSGLISGSSDVPPPEETIDPNTGVRTVVSYARNDANQLVRTTRKLKLTRKMQRVNKNVQRRRAIPKFGDCRNTTAAAEQNVTYESYDEVKLSLAPQRVGQQEENDDPLAKLAGQKSVVVCRLCGMIGDHWTLKCPKRGGASAAAAAERLAAENAEDGSVSPAAASSPAPNEADGRGAGGRYVPPSMRGGARPADRGDDLPTLRVTNLSEDTTDKDLNDLFAPFGHVARIRLARDRVTNRSKGYAFVTFTNRRDAQAAIEKLDGYGYDNLILRVEWSRSMMQFMKDKQAAEAGRGNLG